MTCLACDTIHASGDVRRDLFAAAFAQGFAVARAGAGTLEPLCPKCADAVREAMRVIVCVSVDDVPFAPINVLGHLNREQRAELYRRSSEVDEVSGGDDSGEMGVA